MNRNENAHLVAPSVGAIPDEVEVAMVGAGPVGLTAATMLAGYGVRVAVLDGAAGPAPHSRAAVVHARTLETLAPLGVVDEMVRGGVVVTHFGVRDRDRRLLDVPFGDLPTAHPYSLMLPRMKPNASCERRYGTREVRFSGSTRLPACGRTLPEPSSR
jgi:FAD binding domain